MTYTYDPALSTDKDKVRFHIGDTDPDGAFLEDETIVALIAITGSMEDAAITCLSYIITQLSTPNFRLDWMRVDNEAARKGYEELLIYKRQEFGVTGGFTAESELTHAYRLDSHQDPDNEQYDGSP